MLAEIWSQKQRGKGNIPEGWEKIYKLMQGEKKCLQRSSGNS
jgi:hypothetical protein